MMTHNQIKAYIARYFPGLSVQVLVYGAYRGAVEIYRGGNLRLRIDTRTAHWGTGPHYISGTTLGRIIKEADRNPDLLFFSLRRSSAPVGRTDSD
jgi:hypothetical protein